MQGCRELHYSVLSENRAEVLVLTTNNIIPTFPNVNTVSKINDSVKQYKEDGCISQLLLSTPIYINITLLPCPLGFTLSQYPAQCVCDHQLQKHHIPCDISTQTVHCSGSMWINASFKDNISNGVIIQSPCPFDYCKPTALDVNLQRPDTQCAFDHSGTLCGHCKPGLSLTLGSSQCRVCSNAYLSLLIPLTAAGLLLVFFIHIMNLTVAQGTINGLIFYANIVWTNQSNFFPAGDINPLTVFIAWLNLDLGIEACFFDGLTAYWKTWLQFLFPLYIWGIVALVISIARCSFVASKIFGNTSVPLLATLVLLSYAKLLRTIIVVLRFTILDFPDGSSTAVWSFDGNIPYFSGIHVPLFLVAVAFFLFLWLPYTTVLTFTQCLQRTTNYRVVRLFLKLKPFFDAYFGPLQDKHRYWVGLLLLIRGVLFVVFAITPTNSSTVDLLVTTATVFMILVYLTFVGHVYKNSYLTILENSFFLNLGILAVGTLYIRANGGSQAALVYTSISIAFTEFIAVLLFHVYSLKGKKLLDRFKWRHGKVINQDEYEDLDREEEIQVTGNALRLSYNDYREPVLKYADESTA